MSNLSGVDTPSDLTAGPGGVYFVFDEPSFGAEVWKTDGVSAQRVTDIHPLGGDAYPSYLTSAGARLYFSAQDPTGGYELWSTDGSQVARVADRVLGGPRVLSLVGPGQLESLVG